MSKHLLHQIQLVLYSIAQSYKGWYDNYHMKDNRYMPSQ